MAEAVITAAAVTTAVRRSGGYGSYGPGWGPAYWDSGYADPVVIINNAGVPGSAAAVAPAVSAAVQQVTASATTPAQAQAQLAKLKRSLTAWLDYRGRLDEIIAGKRTGRDASGSVAATQAAKRPKVEQPLATHLYNLLSEVFDPSALPSPNVAANPNAAVQLAQIAISGQLPQRRSSADANRRHAVVVLADGRRRGAPRGRDRLEQRGGRREEPGAARLHRAGGVHRFVLLAEVGRDRGRRVVRVGLAGRGEAPPGGRRPAEAAVNGLRTESDCRER